MKREQVITKLCEIARGVCKTKYNWTLPADCICDDGPFTTSNFEFSPEVLDFISTAVREKLEKEKTNV